MVAQPIIVIIALLLGIAVLGLVVAFVLVPLFKGIGWLIGGLFAGIAWLVRHVFEFISGTLRDLVRLVGAVIAWVVLLPLVVLNVVVARWSAAGHFWRSMIRECRVAVNCLYRVALQRPLRFVLLGGLLEGIEQRVNEAVVAAPPADKPARRTGSFDGYTIVGSLPVGGSGARLHIAEPDGHHRRARELPRRVVIKSFALTDGSSLPQIVRESRALEAARQLGLVLDHGMDEHRFFYVMPYHEGDHLGIVTRQLHGESEGEGLGRAPLATALEYVEDLLETLARYHRGGLWHKDVKPENVIVHDGQAHLVDLGLVTPLRSAMTLTTHGTEYFRDPEMVRMALRGVKVHQVDGAKFDIYAAGAVLYFVLENTFPAHGGLSAVSRRSPEALRWIVRRAMTDYNKRYESIPQMLGDLNVVRAAADPFALRPADLPSMKGVPVAVARGPEAPPAPAAAPVPGPAAPAPAPAPPRAEPVSVLGVRLGGGTQPPAGGRSRPRFRVTNWWTGAYDVRGAEAPASAGQAPHAHDAGARREARVYRDEARTFREQTDALREQVRLHSISARKAAREQIKAARTRAEEVRRRAREHRRQVLGDERQVQPAVALALLTLIVAGVVGIVVLARSAPTHGFGAGQGPLAAAIAEGGLGSLDLRGTKLLVINDHPARTDPFVRDRVQRLLEEIRAQGGEVVTDDQEAEVWVRRAGPVEADRPLPENVEVVLVERHLGGVLRIVATPGDGPAHERIQTVLALKKRG